MSGACVAAVIALGAAVCHGGENWVRFAEDGRWITVGAEGISKFVAVSSAVFSTEDKTHRIGTQDFPMIRAVRRSVGTTPFGDAVVSEVTYGKEDSPFQYTLTLNRLKNLRAFTLQAVFHNRSDKDANLHAFDLLDT